MDEIFRGKDIFRTLNFSIWWGGCSWWGFDTTFGWMTLNLGKLHFEFHSWKTNQ